MEFLGDISLRPARDDDSEFLLSTTRASLGPYVEQTYGPWDDADQRRRFASRVKRDLDQVIEVDAEPVGSYPVREVVAEANARRIPVRLQVFEANLAKSSWLRFGFVLTGETATRYRMDRAVGGE